MHEGYITVNELSWRGRLLRISTRGQPLQTEAGDSGFENVVIAKQNELLTNDVHRCRQEKVSEDHINAKKI